MKSFCCLLPAIMVAGCSFDADLSGQGYVPCGNDTDCAGGCECSKAGVCLPGEGMRPDQCDRSVEDPGRLLRVDWEDEEAVFDLVVDTEQDWPFELAAGDFGTARDKAEQDGDLTLREALALAGLADRPVRIRFDPDVFPADGSGPPIEPYDSLTLEGRKVFLDSRKTGVRLVSPGQSEWHALTVSGEILAIAGLTIQGFSRCGVRVDFATGVYMCNLTLQSNRVGLSIEQSKNVTVVSTDLRGNGNTGIHLGGECENVSIGPVPGREGSGWEGVVVSGHHTGAHMSGFDGQVLIRNSLFDNNELDVVIEGTQGTIGFINNTVANSYHAVLKYYDGPGPLEIYVRNTIFHGVQGLQHLFCYDSAEPLTVVSEYLLFSGAPNVICPGFSNTFDESDDIMTNTDPGFAAAAGGDFRLNANSPAVDAGVETEVQGVGVLDLNGDDPGTFCGTAPDLGAFEYCP